MADPKSIAGEVEGDYSVVKVQLAAAGAGDKLVRPTKGTQVVWGGSDKSSPWGHLAALIEKSGGSVSYTYVHAADLREPLVVVTDEGETHEDTPADQPKADDKKASGDKPAGDKPAEPKHSTGGAEGHGPLFDTGALLLGRSTWERFSGIWPNRTDDFSNVFGVLRWE